MLTDQWVLVQRDIRNLPVTQPDSAMPIRWGWSEARSPCPRLLQGRVDQGCLFDQVWVWRLFGYPMFGGLLLGWLVKLGDFYLKVWVWRTVQRKGVHCVDLGESFPTSIYLQKSASIQPRTSPSKFGGKFNSILFIRVLSATALKRSCSSVAAAALVPSATGEPKTTKPRGPLPLKRASSG